MNKQTIITAVATLAGILLLRSFGKQEKMGDGEIASRVDFINEMNRANSLPVFTLNDPACLDEDWVEAFKDLCQKHKMNSDQCLTRIKAWRKSRLTGDEKPADEFKACRGKQLDAEYEKKNVDFTQGLAKYKCPRIDTIPQQAEFTKRFYAILERKGIEKPKKVSASGQEFVWYSPGYVDALGDKSWDIDLGVQFNRENGSRMPTIYFQVRTPLQRFRDRHREMMLGILDSAFKAIDPGSTCADYLEGLAFRKMLEEVNESLKYDQEGREFFVAKDEIHTSVSLKYKLDHIPVFDGLVKSKYKDEMIGAGISLELEYRGQ